MDSKKNFSIVDARFPLDAFKLSGDTNTDVTRDFGMQTVVLRSESSLDTLCQTVFLSVLKIAALERSFDDEALIKVRSNIKLQITFTCSIADIKKVCELKAHSSKIIQALNKLASTRYIINQDDEPLLMCKMDGNGRNKKLEITLHTCLSEAINDVLREKDDGKRKRSFITIDLNERIQLNSKTAKLLHSYLSSTLHAGDSIKYSVDKLNSKVKSTDIELSKSRRSEFKREVTNLSELDGWTITSYKGIYMIKRREEKINVTVNRPRGVRASYNHFDKRDNRKPRPGDYFSSEKVPW